MTAGALHRLVLAALLAHAATPAAAGALSSQGCLAGGAPARVTAVNDTFEVALDDGRIVLVPGVEAIRGTAADPDGARAARAALAQWLVGRVVTVNPRGTEADRWGRTVALLFADRPDAAPPGGSAISVGEAMIDAGFARAKPDPLVQPCWPVYRTLESRARSAALGLWRDPSYAVAAAGDVEELMRRTGTMALVEGRIEAVRAGRSRTYLAFDEKARSGFTVAVERRVALRLKKAGTDVATWIGKRLRVRGFLDDRFGLQIDLTSLDQVEFIDP